MVQSSLQWLRCNTLHLVDCSYFGGRGEGAMYHRNPVLFTPSQYYHVQEKERVCLGFIKATQNQVTRVDSYLTDEFNISRTSIVERTAKLMVGYDTAGLHLGSELILFLFVVVVLDF